MGVPSGSQNELPAGGCQISTSSILDVGNAFCCAKILLLAGGQVGSQVKTLFQLDMPQ